MTPASRIVIAGREVSGAAAPYLVAEIACAHQGDAGKAAALVDAAAEAGADAVQLELFVPERNMARTAPMYGVVERLALRPATWVQLAERARTRGLAVVAYVYDAGAAEFAMDLRPHATKLNASDLLTPELLDFVAGAGVPFTLGTGAATAEEVGWAVSRVLERSGDLVLMHGVQSFPTPLAQARVRRLLWLKAAFGSLVGYADHTPGGSAEAEVVDLMALGAGACVLEKHLIIDRARDEIDRAAALEPHEWRAWAGLMRTMAEGLGSGRPGPLDEADLSYRSFQRKKPVALRDLAAGHVLAAGDTEALRHPDPGLAANEALVGRRLARAVPAGTPLRAEDLAP